MANQSQLPALEDLVPLDDFLSTQPVLSGSPVNSYVLNGRIGIDAPGLVPPPKTPRVEDLVPLEEFQARGPLSGVDREIARAQRRGDVEQFQSGLRRDYGPMAGAVAGSTLGRELARGTAGIGESVAGAAETLSSLRQKHPVVGRALSRFAGGVIGGPVAQMADEIIASSRFKEAAKKAGDIASETAKAIPVEIEDLRDVKGLQDVPDVMAKALGQIIPQIALMAIPGGFAGRMAQLAGAGSKAATLISGGAAAIPAGIQEMGGNFRGIREETGKEAPEIAALSGGVSGALEVATPLRVLGKYFDETTGPVKKRLWRHLVSETVKEVPKAGGIEFTTEGLQELVSIAANKFADRTYDAVNSENAWRILNAATLGLLGGTGIAPMTTTMQTAMNKVARAQALPAAKAQREKENVVRRFEKADDIQAAEVAFQALLDASKDVGGLDRTMAMFKDLSNQGQTAMGTGEGVIDPFTGQVNVPRGTQPGEANAIDSIQQPGSPSQKLPGTGAQQAGQAQITGGEAGNRAPSPTGQPLQAQEAQALGAQQTLEKGGDIDGRQTQNQTEGQIQGQAQAGQADAIRQQVLTSPAQAQTLPVPPLAGQPIVGQIDPLAEMTRAHIDKAVSEATPPLATTIAEATGPVAILTMVNDPQHGFTPETRAFFAHILKTPGLEGLRIVLLNRGPEGLKAAYSLARGIELTAKARPEDIPHEIQHAFFAVLPEGDKQVIEQARQEALRARFGDKVSDLFVRGMTTEQFRAALQRGLVKIEDYHLSNANEYASHHYTGAELSRFSAAQQAGPMAAVWARVKELWQHFVDALSRAFGKNPNMAQILREMRSGKFRVNPAIGQSSQERAGMLVTTPEEAATEMRIARTRPDMSGPTGPAFPMGPSLPSESPEVTTAKAITSQVSFLVKALEKAIPAGATATITSDSAKAVQKALMRMGYTDLARMQGEALSVLPTAQDFQEQMVELAGTTLTQVRAREAWENLLRLKRGLNAIITEHQKLEEEMKSDAKVKERAKLTQQAEPMAKLVLDQLKQQFIDDTTENITAAQELLTQQARVEGAGEERGAALQRQIEIEKKKLGYTEAVISAVRRIVSAMRRSGSTKIGGKSQEVLDYLYDGAPPEWIIQEYKRLEPEGRPIDMVVEMAARVLSEHREKTRDIIALSLLSESEGVKNDYDAFQQELAEQMKENPEKAVRSILKDVGRFATQAEKAKAAWRAANAKLVRMAENFEQSQIASDMAESVLNDPDTKAFEKLVHDESGSEARPDKAASQDPDNLDLMHLVGPDGEAITVTLFGDESKFAGELEKLEKFSQSITDWMAENQNADDVERLYWARIQNKVDNVLRGTRVTAPAQLKMNPVLRALGGDKYHTMDLLQAVINDIGTRWKGIVTVSANAFARAYELASNAFSKHHALITEAQLAAAKSHGFKADNQGGKRWYEEVGRFLYDEWQNEEGGPEEGRPIGVGYKITKEDMEALRANTAASRQLYAATGSGVTVGREEAGVLPVRFKAGDTAAVVSSAPITKNTLPRTFNPDAVQLSKDWASEQAPAKRWGLLDTFFHPFVTSYMMDRSSQRITGPSQFEKTYSRLAADLKAGRGTKGTTPEWMAFGLPLSNQNMDWLVREVLKDNPTLEESAVRSALMSEFDTFLGTMAKQFVGKTSQEYVSEEEKTSFTKAREKKIAPAWFYRTGFPDSGSFQAVVYSMPSYYATRLAQSLKKALADLEDRVQPELATRIREIINERNVPERTAKKQAEKEQRLLVRLGKTYDDWDNVSGKITRLTKAIKTFEDTLGSEATNNLDTELNRGIRRPISALVRLAMTSTQFVINNMGGGAFNAGQFLNSITNGLVTNYGKAAGTQFGRSIQILASVLWGGAKGIHRSIAERNLRPLIEEITDKAVNRIGIMQELQDAGLSVDQSVYDEMKALLSMPTTGGQIMTDDQSALAKIFTGPLGFIEGLSKPIEALIQSSDAFINQNTSERALGIIKMIEENVRKLYNEHKKLGTLDTRFNLANPNDTKNTLSAQELYGSGPTVTETPMAMLRQWFDSGGVTIDYAAARLMAKLEAGNKKATLLDRNEALIMADLAAQESNKKTVLNRPLSFRRKDPLWQVFSPFLGWNAKTLHNWARYTSRASRDPQASLVKLWAIPFMGLVIAMAVGGGYQEITEELVRLFNWFIGGEKRPTRQWWEREGFKSKSIGIALDAVSKIPFIATIVNAGLNDMPNRASLDPNLFILNRATQFIQYLGNVMKTGDMTYGLSNLVKAVVPLSGAVINRLPGMDGSVEALNARRLLTRYGPQELLAEPMRGPTRTATELTPYGERLLNAAMRGDDAGFMQIYGEAVEVARKMGKSKPEESVAQAFTSRNPYSRAFKSRLTEEQKEEVLTRMNPSERALMQGVEEKFQHAASLVGKNVGFVAREQGSQGVDSERSNVNAIQRSRIGNQNRIGLSRGSNRRGRSLSRFSTRRGRLGGNRLPRLRQRRLSLRRL